MNTRRIMFLVGLTLLLVLSMAGAVASAKSEDADAEMHCIARVIEVGQKASEEAAEAVCFDNFSDAIEAATGGAVKLSKDIQPAEVTEEMLESTKAASTVIGIDYDLPNCQTDDGTITWYAPNPFGCYTGYSYEDPEPPEGWNNRVSSGRAFGGCNRFYHYEHYDYGGAVDKVTSSSCDTFKIMSDEVSSWKWYKTGYHY